MNKKEELKEFLGKAEEGEKAGEGEEKTPQPPEKEISTTTLEFKKPMLGLENVHIGSLALMTIVLILSLWVLVPTASGKTRAELLWLTLFGETRLVTDMGIQGSTSVTGSGPGPIIATTVEGSILPLDFSAMEMGF